MESTIQRTTATNGGIAKPKPVGTIADMLTNRKDLIAAVLPKHMTPERLIKIASVAVARVPKLQQCTGLSLVNSVIKAAELGLDCSGTLGSAYLVPYKTECTLIIGYRGLIDLARRSGQILSIEARVVWTNDVFEVEYGLNPKLVHKPVIDGDSGDFRLVYAVAKLRDGGEQFDVMNYEDIRKIQKRSRAGDSGPWVTDFPEMARKTVVRRLCKYLPMSVEFQTAIASEDEHEFLGNTVVEPRPSKAAALAERMLTDIPAEDERQEIIDEASDADSSQETKAETVNTNTGEVTATTEGTPDVATLERLCREAAISQNVSRPKWNGALFKFWTPKSGEPAMEKTAENWTALLGAITAQKFDFENGKILA